MYIVKKTFVTDQGWVKPEDKLDPKDFSESAIEHYLKHGMIQDEKEYLAEQKKAAAAAKKKAPTANKQAKPDETK